MERDQHVESETEEYEEPAVEDLDTTEGASVTAAGGSVAG